MFKKCVTILLLWAGSMAAQGYSVGDYAEGGVIFFLTPDREHGLVAAMIDQDDGTGAVWADDTKIIDASLDGIFFGENYQVTAGSLNTEQILVAYGSVAAAATLCRNYSVTVSGLTFADWFLPTLMELRIMFKRKDVIEATALANGGTGFAADNYWSSLENLNSATTAVVISFDPANPGTNSRDKSSSCRVRAIRAF